MSSNKNSQVENTTAADKAHVTKILREAKGKENKQKLPSQEIDDISKAKLYLAIFFSCILLGIGLYYFF